MEKKMYDLIVAGAGPAGSSAAITAARGGARVLLLEQKRYPRNKVCGEFVSAESLDLLAWLLDSDSLLTNAHRIPELRFFSDGLVIGSPLDPPAASIARTELDSALWEAAIRSGVDARQQLAAASVRGEGPFEVVTTGKTFEGKAVVKACGRWSNLTSGAQRFPHQTTKWLGVKAHFKEAAPPESVDLYFFDGGYCGVQRVRLQGDALPGRINVCAKVQAGVADTLTDVLEQHPALKQRSRHWKQLTEPVTTSPLIFHRPCPVEGNVLLAGDAAGFVDPFVGDGISLALRSGAFCAQALKPFLAGEISLQHALRSYLERYERDLLPVFGMSSKVRQVFFLLPRMVRVAVLSALKRSPALLQQIVKHTR